MAINTAPVPTAKAAFVAALKIADEHQRRAYLDRACAGRPDLRDEVDRLLEAREAASTRPLDRAIEQLGVPEEATGDVAAVETVATTPEPPAGPSSGPRVGPYKLLEPIGEGGMGTVYMAEQVEPVRRMVALKLIKPGMDTKQVIARFEAERQALAMMDHPNIARVLDAGTTAEGRPYFVMELVKGIPITAYCDQARLSIPERLELFVLVCRAVQHAHQKGVIHRDLKPSNILVTLHDGVPVPKVIDFGIAKATGQSLTDRTLFTAFAQIIGTPLYMSPEQAELSGLDIDTRCDIYALGVLLYELLTGTTPIERETFRTAALDEIRRKIREQDPPPPSSRLSSLGEAAAAVSANRKAEPRHLGRTVRGELDWIVMKALEKDRNRRYETANGLAADVMRHLTDRPVEACPPSTRYRLRKFVRRNQVALTTTALVALALIAGTTVSVWQATQARRSAELARRAESDAERRAKEARQVVDYLASDLLGAAAPQKSRGRTLTVPDLLRIADETLSDRFKDHPLVEASVRCALAQVYLDAFWRHADAERQAARAAILRERVLGPDHVGTLDARSVQAWSMAANSYSNPDLAEAAVPIARRVYLGRLRLLGPAHPDTLWARCILSQAVAYAGRPAEAEPFQTETERLAATFLGPHHPITLAAGDILGRVVQRLGDIPRAEAIFRRNYMDHERVFGPNTFQTWCALYNVADVVQEHGSATEWLTHSLTLVDRGIAIYGPAGPFDIPLGWATDLLRKQGDFAAIRDLHERLLREVLASPAVLGDDFARCRAGRLAGCARTLASLPEQVHFDAELVLQAIEEAAVLDGGWHGWTMLGAVHCRLGRFDEALQAFQTSARQPNWSGGNDLHWFSLAVAHARLGDLARAAECFERGRDPETKRDRWDEIVDIFRTEAALLGLEN